MRVLILHNRYRQAGGEDAAVQSEYAMLRRHGVEVFRDEVSNDFGDGLIELATTAVQAAWSRDSYQRIRELCGDYQPDLVHVHNFWMRLSPSAHAACRESGAATVQSLHNYRLACVNGLFLRNGKQCTDCLGKSPWRGVLHRCKDGSIAASAAVAHMIAVNRKWGTWEHQVDAFIAPSLHVRGKMIANGLDADRVFVKPNFTTDPGAPETRPSESTSAVFAGRLSEEKGLTTLLDAWAAMPQRADRKLVLLGDGPERTKLEQRAAALHLAPNEVVFAGRCSPDEVREEMQRARFVLLPSLSGETFGTSIVEGFACGRAAIVTTLGGQNEIVRHGSTGWKVAPGNVAELTDALDRLFTQRIDVDELGANARREYLARFTSARNFQLLMQIYGQALAHAGRTVAAQLAEELV